MNRFLQGYLDDERHKKPATTDAPAEQQTEESKGKRLRGRYRRAIDRPDTVPALRALMNKLDGDKPSLRGCARILGTGHSALHGYLSGKRAWPTLDTMCALLQSAHDETGLVMRITFGPNDEISWSFE